LPVFDTYSKRRKRELGQTPDIYTYDKIPPQLKVQIIHIWREVIGIPTIDMFDHIDERADIYQAIIQVLRKEVGVFRFLSSTHNPNDKKYAHGELCEYFLGEKDVDDDLSIIELTFRYMDLGMRNQSLNDEQVDDAIAELNVRFDEHGVGYQYSDGIVIRRDSELVHKEVVKPTLLVLRGSIYKSAQEEFLSAHEHYRNRKMTEALVDACKAFESTMKIICTKRGWKVDTTKPASQLIQVCLDNGLIPAYWQAHFSHLRGMLEASIPTARNKQGGHGAGALPPHNPPRELVAYVLHMTASTILFLAEAEKALP